MKLSARLTAVIDLLDRPDEREEGAKAAKPFACVADVGCDHGFVSIALIESGIAEAVIASDVREGPLSRAREHVEAYGMTKQIRTVLSDGMRHLTQGSADAAVLAGMGGLLIRDILSEAAGREALPETLVLAPQSHPEDVRRCLQGLGFVITAEDMVLEDGKYYPIIRAKKGVDQRDAAPRCEIEPALWEKAKEHFGPCLLSEGHPVLLSYLQKQREQFSGIVLSLPKEHEKRRELEDTIAVLEAALRGGCFHEA